jgi:hypothetical protein
MNEGLLGGSRRDTIPKVPFLDYDLAEADCYASASANSLRALRGTSGGSLSHGGL